MSNQQNPWKTPRGLEASTALEEAGCFTDIPEAADPKRPNANPRWCYLPKRHVAITREEIKMVDGEYHTFTTHEPRILPDGVTFCILEVAAMEFLDAAFKPADWGVTNNRLTWYVWHMVKGHRTMASEGEGESRVDALISAVLNMKGK